MSAPAVALVVAGVVRVAVWLGVTPGGGVVVESGGWMGSADEVALRTDDGGGGGGGGEASAEVDAGGGGGEIGTGSVLGFAGAWVDVCTLGAVVCWL